MILHTHYKTHCCSHCGIWGAVNTRVIRCSFLFVGPQEVTDLEINDASRINDSTVMFSIVWVRPSDSNGSFHYVLEYEAAQLEPHPQSRQRNVSLIQERLDNGKQETFTFEGALPFANYTITLTPVNTKLTKPGPNVTIAGRTRAIGK